MQRMAVVMAALSGPLLYYLCLRRWCCRCGDDGDVLIAGNAKFIVTAVYFNLRVAACSSRSHATDLPCARVAVTSSDSTADQEPGSEKEQIGRGGGFRAKSNKDNRSLIH